MNDKKAPKLKFANIASKIDSGLPKNSSTATVSIKSRQQSVESRASSRQGNSNPIGRKPFSTSTTRQIRPTTSDASSMRFSQASNMTIESDKLPKNLHKLGTLPRYLQGAKRPATASSRLQTREPQSGKSVREAPKKAFESMHHKQLGRDFKEGYATFKDTLDGIVGQRKKSEGVKKLVKKVQREGTWSLGQNARPPCEGCGDTQEQQRKIYELLVKIENKAAVIKEREDDIEQLKNTVESLCTISTSRDTISRDGLRDLELKLSKIQADVTQKSKELIKSEQKVTTLEHHVEELNQQLVDVKKALEDKQIKIQELTNKTTDEDSLKDRLDQAENARRSSEELTEKLQLEISSLKEELAKRDDQISELKSNNAVESIKAELEDRRAEVESLQTEIKRLQYEKLLLNVGEQISSRTVDEDEDQIEDETEPSDEVDLS